MMRYDIYYTHRDGSITEEILTTDNPIDSVNSVRLKAIESVQFIEFTRKGNTYLTLKKDNQNNWIVI